MRSYETVVILKEDLTDEAIEEALRDLQTIIKDNGGEMSDIEIWGKRRLAYEIQDYLTGFYSILKFQGQGSTINELDRILKIRDDVLRHLTVLEET